ncbi:MULTISPECIES: MaoC family dehydratase [Streptomyces]|jgi:acyl dehydratase|uniref:Dehydratase n=2 Tax=Streptomyces TaxID=1883 RepID=A0A117QIW6_STRCK|nr:MaoC family dehydratase [Streptomyces corchorusii]AEY91208.1 MaoC-like dehydratase [Streptomyces hygroscopicus subsp. jinggangensis 5008]AGF65366.1 MaoC-like dehydratase [Streptomyces hygroscopicus subsp. jinggangensis TL01]ALO95679.1 MaoC-like dehydratase [Streptomyces hygroscopicus subsp. limoneus]KUN30809.1 dehydratase [Streptomyces corchorusii]
MRSFASLDEFSAAVGEHLGHSEWLRVTQEQVDQFAGATGDSQWIHTDPERAATGPFGGTILHGYLTLALLPAMMRAIFDIEKVQLGVNFGLDKVRFPRPVPVGSRVRGGAKLTGVRETPAGHLAAVRMTVEVEGEPRAACVADTLSLFVAP